MGSPFLYYVVLVLVLLWVRTNRGASVGSLFALWWTGIVLSRLTPVLVENLASSWTGSSEATLRAGLVTAAAVGNILIIRAVLGLASSGRTWRRRTYVALALLLVALLLAPAGAGSGVVLTTTLGIGYLVSVPWRSGRGASFLAFAAFTGLVSFLFMIVTVDVETASGPLPSSAFTQSLFTAAGPLAALYGIVTAFRSVSRIHLSIRRVSRRLVASHLMSGFVPVLLVALFLFLAGGLYLSTYRGQIASRYLSSASEQARERMSASLAKSGEIAPNVFGVASAQQTVLIQEEGLPVTVLGDEPSFPPEALLASADSSADVPLVWDRQQLYVRARLDTLREGSRVRYEVLAPLDSLDLARVSRVVGVPVQVAPRMVVRSSGNGVQISSEDDEVENGEGTRRDSTGAETDPGWTMSLGNADPESTAERSGDSGSFMIGPPTTSHWRLPGGALVACLRFEDGEFLRGEVPILSSASFAESVSALVSVARENPLATVGLIVLAFITILLLGVISHDEHGDLDDSLGDGRRARAERSDNGDRRRQARSSHHPRGRGRSLERGRIFQRDGGGTRTGARDGAP